jgi:hypothetical protein
MAGLNRKSLRVSGLKGANSGAVACLPRTDSEPAAGQRLMEHLSFTSHLMYPATELDPNTRPDHLKTGMSLTVRRAGRPGCSNGGTLGQRSARFAGSLIQFGWAAFGRAATATMSRDPGKVSGLKWSGSQPSGHSRIPPGRTLPVATLKRGNLQRLAQCGDKVPSVLARELGMSRSAAQGK